MNLTLSYGWRMSILGNSGRLKNCHLNQRNYNKMISHKSVFSHCYTFIWLFAFWVPHPLLSLPLRDFRLITNLKKLSHPVSFKTNLSFSWIKKRLCETSIETCLDTEDGISLLGLFLIILSSLLNYFHGTVSLRSQQPLN
jgi:hypothetical protein